MINNIKPYSYQQPSFQGRQKFTQILLPRAQSIMLQDEIAISPLNIFYGNNFTKKIAVDFFVPTTAKLTQKASKIVTDDKKLQLAIQQLILKEAVIIRDKKDALPIIKKQYLNIKNQNPDSEIFVLNINPQTNRGLPKSNSLISKWFVEENNLHNNFITEPSFDDVFNKLEKFKCINKNEKSSSLTFKNVIDALNMLDMKDIDGSIRSIKEKYGNLDEIYHKGHELFGLKKKAKNYSQNIALLLKENIDKKNTTVIIPDDCSLSGASMLCDTVKILDSVYDGSIDSQTKTKFVFSPLILGTKAKKNMQKFIDKNTELDDVFYNDVCATEELKSAFKKIKRLIKDDKIQFEIVSPYKVAKPFVQTETFKKIGQEDKQLQEKLYNIMRCPNGDLSNVYEGFNNCGVMVITPTESFQIKGKTYSGKVPTNCVGFMEVLGITMGVLNDAFNPMKKAVFVKGTGKGYAHYSQKENILHSKRLSSPIRISVNKETGKIEVSNVIQKYYVKKIKNFIAKFIPIFIDKDIKK